MAVFASHFWLWSIVGLMGLVMLYTLSSLLNFGGFITPLKRIGEWIDAASPRVRLSILGLAIVLIGYPSLVHKFWADATASEIRRLLESIPMVPGARQAQSLEQWGGLYDPTGTDGAYIISWFGASATAAEVQTHYREVLAQRGWVEHVSEGRSLRFRDHPEVARSHYELVLALSQSGGAEVPPGLAGGDPTVFALRLGAVDPRVTTQVAWLIDCLVRFAPTFPSCEAMGWHPLEGAAGALPGSRPVLGR